MKVGFDEGIKLEFHGATVTSDGGLLAYRDLDDALGLFEPVSALLWKRKKESGPSRQPAVCMTVLPVR